MAKSLVSCFFDSRCTNADNAALPAFAHRTPLLLRGGPQSIGSKHTAAGLLFAAAWAHARIDRR